ncbi:GNAT family N-acetyltransferase [Paenibacillus chondroitinus]|uniref:GNAT family N-acetyltransferase n=1 Tax=Paenibacillus chondroitinus TaxID=59842 RepID=A0ABU6D511_9BACL|nr:MULTISPECIES: GNAT family N-acetyltransferase [Paenibacillus]MCY9658808.1 GNAT family N-acetyltransferase [Paenibacillus anseongense]MEB4792806.1 GNAT family N-acetyltransferase [Paenibacillus chondroitinus]
MQNYIWSGKKVRLRPVLASDWEKFHLNDLDSEGARHCDVIYFPRSEEGTKAWAANQAGNVPVSDNVMLAIETLDGELVGSISTSSCDRRHGTFKYGVAVFREHWRKGYASDAIKILLRYYFEELRYQKVTAHVYAFNEGSVALHERLGFVQEGRLRNMIFTKGQHFDECLFGLTKGEYENLVK